MQHDRLIEHLKALGINAYEARVYLALLRQSPATGYELSRAADIPQSRAYEALKSMEVKHMVAAVGEKPVTYSPVQPEMLLDRLEQNYKESFSFLRDALPKLTTTDLQPAMNLQGEQAIVAHALSMIDRAQETVLLEVWSNDVPPLKEAVERAAMRGVDVKVVGYDDVQLATPCQVYSHGSGEPIEGSFGCRWLILAIDGQESLVGTLSSHATHMPQGVYTRNPGLVVVVKELIIHDLFLLDVEKTMPQALEQAYGKQLNRLRQKVLGSSEKIGFH
ncbi:MAG: helix-turn-helix domain-containing protein [Vampirovibrionales bacterium]|nr:helix-turn-helix domain-containing protein [Vampirovibrionales bacterium]